jgi:septum formation protein
LASASPRRHELLAQLGVEFEVVVTDIDESVRAGESPADYTRRLAVEKALAGFDMHDRAMPALGADTIVLLDGEILCKPLSREAAVCMLQRLSGQTHEVYSAVSLALATDRVRQALNVTKVTFADMPLDWIKRYCQGDEPMDKAGAYAVQGGTAQFIRRIEGSYSGVMGLPLYETAKLLREAGLLT